MDEQEEIKKWMKEANQKNKLHFKSKDDFKHEDIFKSLGIDKVAQI